MNLTNNLLPFNSASNLPVYSEKLSLYEYIKKVNTFPILEEEEEKLLLTEFTQNGNLNAAKIILNSHLRLVVKIAMQYKKFYSSLMELIAEGNIGLVKALKNFSLAKEVRFSTYAMLWVKASIKDFLLKSFSSIKLSATASSKKLMFNLSKAKKFLGIAEYKTLKEEEVEQISNLLNVKKEEIINHERMMAETKVHSLNEALFEEGENEKEDFTSNGENLEETQIKSNSQALLKTEIKNALSLLNEREASVLKHRFLAENKLTLLELSNMLQISKERVRQIEEAAIKKLRTILEPKKQYLSSI